MIIYIMNIYYDTDFCVSLLLEKLSFLGLKLDLY